MAPSFYEKEQNRVQKLIKEPLLELILQYLPHLQTTEAARADVWEVVATKLNTISFADTLSSKGGKIDEIPILSGRYVSEVYEKLIKEFVKSTYMFLPESRRSEFVPPRRETYDERPDRILCELFYLRGYDIEVMAKLSKEKYEETVRQASEREADASGEEKDDAVATEPGAARLLIAEKQKSFEKKLALLEQKLESKNAQIEKLTVENKRLLDLNHELVTMNGNQQ